MQGLASIIPASRLDERARQTHINIWQGRRQPFHHSTLYPLVRIARKQRQNCLIPVWRVQK